MQILYSIPFLFLSCNCIDLQENHTFLNHSDTLLLLLLFSKHLTSMQVAKDLESYLGVNSL